MAKVTQVTVDVSTGTDVANSLNSAMASVETDATLTGDGNTGSPLSVANEISGFVVSLGSEQSGTSYTLTLADSNKSISFTNAAPISLTIPSNASVAFAVGIKVVVRQIGLGQITIVGDSGVTVNAGGGGLKTLRQYSVFTLEKNAADEWLAYGELTA